MGETMRGMLAGAFLTLLVPQAVAQTAGIPHPGGAAEINVLTPGVVYNAGLQDLAADYAGQTGIKVTVRNDGMAAIVGDIKKAAPIADVIVLPVAFMDGMEAEQAIVAGSRSDLGRDSVWLAVKRGAPHPDISTPEKLARALKTGVVLYSNPASGSMEARIINDMLRRYPVFQGVRSRISIKGEGGEALMRGEGDMALQLACEVLNHPEIELAGLVPAELGAYIDTAVAVSARSTQAEAARAFIVWLLRPEHAALWKSRGLNRR